MSKILLILVAVLLPAISFGQQQPSSSRYTYNPLCINPAFAGYYNDPVFNVSARGQFGGVEGAPQSAYFSLHGKLLSPKVGLGGIFIHDKIGVTNTNGVYGSYAYKLISKNKNSYTSWGFHKSTLSFGLLGGLTFYSEDLVSLNVNNDPDFEENISIIIPNIGFGVFFNKRNFYVSLSSPQLLRGNLKKNVNLVQHFYLNSGVNIMTSHYTTLSVNGLLRVAPGAPSQIDISTSLMIKKLLQLGVGYRSNDALNFMLGLNVSSQFRFGYFHDIHVHNTSAMYNNVHELMLQYRLSKANPIEQKKFKEYLF